MRLFIGDILSAMFTRSRIPSYRFMLGVFLLIALTLYSGWQSIQYYDIRIIVRQYDKYGHFLNEDVSRLERRLACLKEELAQTELVGFISPLQGDDLESVHRLTQYAMAPTIVVKGEVSGKMIAVYPDEKDLKLAQFEGYSIVVDCKNGVGLLTMGGKE